MRKLSVSAVAVLASLLVLAPVSAAHADTQDDAISTLQSSQLYVESSISVNVSAVEDALSGSDIAVVVVPSYELDSGIPARDYAQQILNSTSHETVVVVFDKAASPLWVVSKNPNLDTSGVFTAVSDNGGNAINALPQVVEYLKTAETTTGTTVPGFEPNAGGSAVAGVVGGIVGGVLVIGVIAFFIRRARKNLLLRGNQYDLPNKVSEAVPSKLHALIRQLGDNARRHATMMDNITNGSANRNGEVRVPNLVPDLTVIVRNLTELFTRINKKGTDSQKNIAEVEYVDKLTKLNEALGANYFLDIAKQPELWDESQERLDSVQEAVGAVKVQLVDNIKQVNASKDLEFQVVLKSLVGSKGTSVKDIYNPDMKREIK